MAYSTSTGASGLEDYDIPYPQSSTISSENYTNSATGLRTNISHNTNDSVSSNSDSTISIPNYTSSQRTMASRNSMSQQSHPYQQQSTFQQLQLQQHYYPVQQQLSVQRPSTAGDRIGSTRRFTTNAVPPMPIVSQLTTETQQRRNVNDASSDLSSAVSFESHLDPFVLGYCAFIRQKR